MRKGRRGLQRAYKGQTFLFTCSSNLNGKSLSTGLRMARSEEGGSEGGREEGGREGGRDRVRREGGREGGGKQERKRIQKVLR